MGLEEGKEKCEKKKVGKVGRGGIKGKWGIINGWEIEGEIEKN